MAKGSEHRVESTVTSDPILVTPTQTRVQLRIGERRQGETRYAILTVSQARQIAYALLAAAEAADS